MDVKIFFNPVTERLFHGIDSNYSFYKNIFLPGPAFPDIKKADINKKGQRKTSAMRDSKKTVAIGSMEQWSFKKSCRKTGKQQ